MWAELRSTGIFLAPWLALVVLSVYVLHSQERLITDRLGAISQQVEEQTRVLGDIRDAMSTSGLVVPPFQYGGQRD